MVIIQLYKANYYLHFVLHHFRDYSVCVGCGGDREFKMLSTTFFSCQYTIINSLL